jgi:hypothetical protein
MIGFTSVVCIYSICPVAVRGRCPPALLNVSAHPVTWYASVVRSFKHVLVLVVFNNTETPEDGPRSETRVGCIRKPLH